MPSMPTEYNEIYYKNNRNKLLDHLKQNITCDKCGSVISRACLYRHRKTDKCKLKYELILLMQNDRHLKE